MAIEVDTLIEVTLNMTYLAQQVAMVFQYDVDLNPTPGNAAQWGEAWWNFVKAPTRALASSGFTNAFRSVKVRNLDDPLGDYGTFDIPVAEQSGTRGGTLGDPMPPYTAVGVQLVVGTRVTRPGQKRIPFVAEIDNASGALGGTLSALAATWATAITAPMSLGAPLLGNRLIPVVVRKNADGVPLAAQNITGFLVNSNLTTQNSRKIGRGQ